MKLISIGDYTINLAQVAYIEEDAVRNGLWLHFNSLDDAAGGILLPLVNADADALRLFLQEHSTRLEV